MGITDECIEMAGEIFRELGPGYSEKIYQNSFEYLLRRNNIRYESEKVIPVKFQGVQIGTIRSDVCILNENNKIILVIEMKAIVLKSKMENELNQLQRYMLNLRVEQGLLINFPCHSAKIHVIPLKIKIKKTFGDFQKKIVEVMI